MLFSKRKNAAENPSPSALRYELPMEFRNQVIHIWRDSIGYSEQPFVDRTADFYEDELRAVQQIHRAYSVMHKALCDEYGVLALPESENATGPCQALRIFLQSAKADRALDAIEISFRMLPEFQEWLLANGLFQPVLDAHESIEKLNARFKEHAIGYRFEHDRIIRIDSEFLHAEAVEPALQLMYVLGYDGAFQEFILAHKHYRQGPDHYDDCLTNCLKSLESTLKTICDRRKWKYNPLGTASKLFDSVFSNGLIPDYLQSHFSGLRCALESGVPTIRNREGGHGSGEKPNIVPEYLAAFQLHLTASAIVFLIRANEDCAKPKR
jgi:AbiJ N-terminal domain 4